MSSSLKRIDLSVNGVLISSHSDPEEKRLGEDAPLSVLQGIVVFYPAIS